MSEVFKSLFLSLCLFLAPESAHSTPSQVRAVIDIGSGGLKLRVAEVDSTTNSVLNILHQEIYDVPFQISLTKSADQTFLQEVMERGLSTCQLALSIAKEHGATQMVIIATEAFRSAKNGQEYAADLSNKTGIHVQIIDQTLEGCLAFEAARDKTKIVAEELITWDIGGGSTQFIAGDSIGANNVSCHNVSSVKFRNTIIRDFQKRGSDCKSPNPLSNADIYQAVEYAKQLSQEVDPLIRDKMSNQTTEVVGVGPVFGRNILRIMQGKNLFTLRELSAVVGSLAGKTDAEYGDGPFNFADGANALLVFGYMEGLNIQKLHIVDVDIGTGALIYPYFWR